MNDSTPPRILILGAGFGGLELSSRLSEEFGADVQVTLIDQHDSFVFGYSKLDVLFGKQRAEEVRLHYRDIAKPGVVFCQEAIQSIDPVAKRVVTEVGTHDADILVIALGADYDVAATPGVAEDGNEFYSVAGAERAHGVLEAFDGGVVVIGVLGPFFKCPPAPFETAFMVHEMLEARGIRDRSTIYVLSTLPSPVPVSSEVSEGVISELGSRDIEFWPSSRVTALDPGAHVATLEDGRTLAYDLFLAIPVHVAPPVVVTSGLTEDDGWIGVDHRNFATKFPDVYAVGDVTSAPVPRAGVIAEGEAKTVGDVLTARIRDLGDAPAYTGVGVCYIDLGNGLTARANVEFLGPVPPHATYTPPSAEVTAQKAEFGASRRRRWFGTE